MRGETRSDQSRYIGAVCGPAERKVMGLGSTATAMPSTLVHLAFGGMIAAALLGDVFDRRALLVVLVVTAAPDLDSFIALVSEIGRAHV